MQIILKKVFILNNINISSSKVMIWSSHLKATYRIRKTQRKWHKTSFKSTKNIVKQTKSSRNHLLSLTKRKQKRATAIAARMEWEKAKLDKSYQIWQHNESLLSSCVSWFPYLYLTLQHSQKHLLLMTQD